MKITAIVALLLPISGIAQERILGLIEIPALHSGLNEGGSATDQATGPVNLYSEPDINSAVAVVIRDRRELESREHDYEQVSAVVFDRAEGRGENYYRLRTSGDNTIFGWIRQDDVGRFRSIRSLLTSKGLTYLTDSWDGRLYEAPGLDSPWTSPAGLANPPETRTISLHQVGSEIWYLVALVRGSCTGDPLEVISTGWVPEYAESGGNTMWYYSRGC